MSESELASRGFCECSKLLWELLKLSFESEIYEGFVKVQSRLTACVLEPWQLPSGSVKAGPGQLDMFHHLSQVQGSWVTLGQHQCCVLGTSLGTETGQDWAGARAFGCAGQGSKELETSSDVASTRQGLTPPKGLMWVPGAHGGNHREG